MRFSLFSLAFAALSLAAPISQRCDSCDAPTASAISAGLDIAATLKADIDANAYAHVVTDLNALIDARAKIEAIITTVAGDEQKSCSDAIIQIDATVDLCLGLVAELAADLGVALKANVEADVKALIAVIVDLRAVLALWIKIGGGVGSSCSGILLDLNARIIICINAYLTQCHDALTIGITATIEICLAILTDLKVLCTGDLLAQVEALITLCAQVTANVHLKM